MRLLRPVNVPLDMLSDDGVESKNVGLYGKLAARTVEARLTHADGLCIAHRFFFDAKPIVRACRLLTDGQTVIEIETIHMIKLSAQTHLIVVPETRDLLSLT